jgi:alginate O-acetyltransferase complex protein AlgI
MMALNSVTFLFAFLPLVLILYRIAAPPLNKFVLLGASVFFYAFAQPEFVFVVAACCLFDWLLGRTMQAWPTESVRRLCLIAGITSNLGILVSVKYANFAAANLNVILAPYGVAFGQLAIALPIGISFIVFEKISYIVDVYRGVSRPTRSPIDYFLFVFLFPKLTAGPIIKYHDIAAQLSQPRSSAAGRTEGLARFVVGLAKKVLIADTMAEPVNAIFALPTAELTFVTAWLGALCFSIQIFFDFSGYSDMAIGLAKVFGFELQENFNQPYRARNFGEFWRRWHISLSTWIRDYLYVPLGGSRGSTGRTYLNLLTCFLASGIWHGASWTFVAWGLYHGAFIVLHRLSSDLGFRPLPAPVSRVGTFLLITLGWVIFRCPTFAQASGMLRVMFDPSTGATIIAGEHLGSDIYFFLLVGMLLSFMPEDIMLRLAKIAGRANTVSVSFKGAGLAVLLLLCCGRAVTATFNPFLYFRF